MVARVVGIARWLCLAGLVGLLASGAGCERRFVSPDATLDGGLDANDRDVGNDAAVEELVLYPVEREIIVRDGVIPRVPLEARLRVGTAERPIAATFTVTPGRLAILDGTELVPTGVAGGEVRVRVQANGAQGRHVLTETFTVRLEATVFGPGVDHGVAADFGAARESAELRAPALGYPLADVVIPTNLASPAFAWPSGGARYVDRLTISKPFASVVYYGSGTFTPELSSWRGVVRTSIDEPIEVELVRLEPAMRQRSRPARTEMHVARTALSGSVYYWNVAATRILRVDDGAARHTDFMPNPGGCVGCHAVSISGRHMVTSVEGGTSGFAGSAYDLSGDLTGAPAPRSWEYTSGGWYAAAISPDETTVIGATDAGLVAADLETGELLGVSRTITGATQPTFTPDGRFLVYVETPGIGPTGEGSISYVPFRRAGAFVDLGDSQSLVATTGLQYPTFSPDGELLVFGRAAGGLSVARVVRGVGERMVIDPPQSLTNANVGQSVHPVFSPFVGDGRYWLSFHTRRPYAPGGAGPFVWVSAIRTTWRAGEDPSQPPYWLIGQSTSDQNLSAFWSRRPCSEPGEVCTVDVECCSGYCRIPPGDTTGSCSDDLACRLEGESCATSSDCCAGDFLECIDLVCVQRVE